MLFLLDIGYELKYTNRYIENKINVTDFKATKCCQLCGWNIKRYSL